MKEIDAKIESILQFLEVIEERVKSLLKLLPSETGKVGGSAKSDAKAEAARENGKKGGRPRTRPA